MTVGRVNRLPQQGQELGRVQNAAAAAEAVTAGLGGTGVLVADLDPVPVDGARAFVTDATAPAFAAAVVGGGAVPVPVYAYGAVWYCG